MRLWSSCLSPHTEAHTGSKFNSLTHTHPSRWSVMTVVRYPAPFNRVALSSSSAAVIVWSKMTAPDPAIAFAFQLVRKGMVKGGAPISLSHWPGPSARAHGTAREAEICSPLYPTNTSATVEGETRYRAVGGLSHRKWPATGHSVCQSCEVGRTM